MPPFFNPEGHILAAVTSWHQLALCVLLRSASFSGSRMVHNRLWSYSHTGKDKL